jgi:hypothetical protein
LKKDVSTQPVAESITPLANPKKDEGNGRDNHGSRYRFKALVLMCSFMLLIIGGGWLLHFLSRNPLEFQVPSNTPLSPVNKAPEKTIEPPKEPPPAVDPVKLGMERSAAEQKLAEYLEASGKLDQKAVSRWGGETYLEMSRLGQQADAHFMEKQYGPATDLYHRATGLAVELANRADEVLQRLLAEGTKALDEGAGASARQHFTLALEIAPDDAKAQRGLKRAETIEAVMQLIESGERQEADNALTAARADYSKALEIDPDSEKARRALQRIRDLIQEKDFQEMMSAGLTAFHQNDLRLARTRLLKAKSLKPESREVSDALFQVSQAIRLADIDNLRRKAQAAERSEDWRSALESYLAALDIDNSLKFAVQGKERALEQIQIDKRIHFFLNAPQTLESENQLENAVQLIEEAKKIERRGSLLSTRIEALEKLVEIAQTPVKIAIESDNLTQVAVYRVGKLGRFSLHELELRPGTYTVVGTRDGYQDVRQKIMVKPGLESLRITVKCRVKI